MFEAGLSLSIYLVNSIAGSVYMQKFLRGRYPKKFALFAWTSLYFIIQSLVLERLNRTHPLNELVGYCGCLTLANVSIQERFVQAVFCDSQLRCWKRDYKICG